MEFLLLPDHSNLHHLASPKPQGTLGLSLLQLSNGKLKKKKKQLVWIIYKFRFIFHNNQCLSAQALIFFLGDTASEFL